MMTDDDYAQLCLRLAAPVITGAQEHDIECIVLCIRRDTGRPFTAATMSEDHLMDVFRKMANNAPTKIIERDKDQ